MTALPPSPFVSDSVASPFAADTAVASILCPVGAAAGPQSSTSTGGYQEAPAAADPNTAVAGLLAEIEDAYEAVRLLAREEHAANHRFRLDVRAFMEAIEPPPLFLQFEKIS